MVERPRFAEALRRDVGVELTVDNDVALVLNGRIFDVMVEEIARARETVHLEMYIWRDGRASARVEAALAERAQAGVRCRVLVDPLGTRVGFSDVGERLERAGVEVRRFVRDGEIEPTELPARSHRKLLVVDGRVALIGGWCIWDEFLGDGRGKHAWRDTNARVCGPALAQMQRGFAEQWRIAGGEIPEVDATARTEPCGQVRAAFVPSPGNGHVTGARALTRFVIEAAQKRVWLSIAYFVPEDDLIERVRRRVAEGVDVRVLVPGPVHDLFAVRLAQRATYRTLRRAGVRIFEYQPSMMHSKTMLADDWLGVVGSINLEPMSQSVIEEASLVFDDPRLVQELAVQFEADVARAREIHRARATVLTAMGRVVRAVMNGFARTVHFRRRLLLRRG